MTGALRTKLTTDTVLVAALVAGLAALYGQTLARLTEQWWSDPEYSHGLICVPLAAWLVWRRRSAWRDREAAPHWSGLVIALGGLALLVVGRLAAELFLTRLSLPVFVAGTLVFTQGWRRLRVLALPFALLVLSIPIPAVLVTDVTLPLQLFASATAETLLSSAAVPILREGNVLMLPNATLQVEEACSGIRSLVTLVTLALLVARYSAALPTARLAIVVSAVPAAVIVNAARVTATAGGTYWFGLGLLDGLAHDTVGAVTFVVALGLVAACGRVIGGWCPAAEPHA